MYAVVQVGSKQFLVRNGDTIYVDLFDAEVGQIVDLQNVLLLSEEDGTVQVGQPVLAGKTIKAKYIAEVKGPKITSLKYKKRKNYCRKFGHRQRYVQLEIVDVRG